MVIGPQEKRLPENIVAFGLIHFRFPDIFHQTVSPSDAHIEFAPVAADFTVGRRHIVIADRTLVHRIGLVTDIRRQAHAAQHGGAVKPRLGHCCIDAVKSCLELPFGRIIVVRIDEILRFRIQQAA